MDLLEMANTMCPAALSSLSGLPVGLAKSSCLILSVAHLRVSAGGCTFG
jgi:hypothetical protein